MWVRPRTHLMCRPLVPFAQGTSAVLALVKRSAHPHNSIVGGAYRTARTQKGVFMPKHVTKAGTAGTTTTAASGTIVGTVGGCPYTPATLPAGVTKNSAALWLAGNTAQNLCAATLASFIAANGGPGNVGLLHVKGKTPVNLAGLNAQPGTTRYNCLMAHAHGVSLKAAQAAAKYGPPAAGRAPQKGRPNIKSATVAILQATYNPNKYPMAQPVAFLVALS